MNRIGIVSALSLESRCLTGNTIPVNKPVQINEHAVAIVSGMGEDNARICAKTLLEQNISALVSWGTAGALAGNIQSGDLLLADSVISSDGNQYSFDIEWGKRIANELCNTSLKIHHGIIAHSQHILAIFEDKKKLYNKTNAMACDMESFAIAKIANDMKRPCISVRAIVDEAPQCIPETIIKNIDIFGRPSLIPILSSLVRNPGLVTEIIKLSSSMKAATTTLSIVSKKRALFSGAIDNKRA